MSADSPAMRKILIAAVAAACLAVPAFAGAHEENARPVDFITCGDGTTLTPPFEAPVCGDDGGIARIPCVSGDELTPPLDGKRCPVADETKSDDDGSDSADEPSARHKKFDRRPHFKAA